MNIQQTTYHANQGFALLEVLIAVLIFSIGLLGLAGLQVTSLKFTSGAYQLTQFSETSYEMTDRMRANIPGVIAGDYLFNIAHDALPAYPGFDCVTSFGTGSRCTKQQLALAERFQWANQLSTLFTGGWNAAISCADIDNTDTDPCTSGSIHTIQIAWRDKAGVEAEDANNDGTPDDGELDGIVWRTFTTSFRQGQ